MVLALNRINLNEIITVYSTEMGETGVQPTRKRLKTHLQFQLRTVLIYFCPVEVTNQIPFAPSALGHSLHNFLSLVLLIDCRFF